MKDFPTPDMQMTNIIVVQDLLHSMQFYRDVLKATLLREYGGTSAVFNFLGNWLLLVTGGGPTEDKPQINFVTLPDKNKITQVIFSFRFNMKSERYIIVIPVEIKKKPIIILNK